MKVMLDLNVILDVVTNRPKGVLASARACTIVGGGMRARAVVSPHAVTTIYYLARKHADKRTAERAVDWMTALFDLAPCGKSEIRRAHELPISDFEDAVVSAAAEAASCDYIVTRNLNDFKGSPVAAISPEDFCRLFYRCGNKLG